MDRKKLESSVNNSLVPFGAGLAVGGLVVGVFKALCVLTVATGVAIGVNNLFFNKDEKESDTCKSGQKQN
jgi:hypothetical protein